MNTLFQGIIAFGLCWACIGLLLVASAIDNLAEAIMGKKERCKE